MGHLAVGFPTLNDPRYLILLDDIGASNSGSQRKLKNLLKYLNSSRQKYPEACIRVVAVTDAADSKTLAKAVHETLGGQAAEFASLSGWKLLPLHTIGTWVKGVISEQRNVPEKMKYALTDFIEWCD